jgi:hypothetical protein
MVSSTPRHLVYSCYGHRLQDGCPLMVSCRNAVRHLRQRLTAWVSEFLNRYANLATRRLPFDDWIAVQYLEQKLENWVSLSPINLPTPLV